MQTHRPVGTGDILAVRKEEVVFYFMETQGYSILDDFAIDEGEDVPLCLTLQARGVAIPGKPGIWNVINSTAVENDPFFLLQSAEHGENAKWLIASETGEVVIDDNSSDFDDAVIRRIRQYLHPELSSSPPSRHAVPASSAEKTDSGDTEQTSVQKRTSLRQRLKDKQQEIQMEKSQNNMTVRRK